jgi:hypothetical protein
MSDAKRFARQAINKGDDAMKAVVEEAAKGDVSMEIVVSGALAAQANYLRAIALALVGILEAHEEE